MISSNQYITPSPAVHPLLEQTQWLKRPKARDFHAYASDKAGERAICHKGPVLESVENMHLPVGHSVCCMECFSKLYKIDIAPRF